MDGLVWSDRPALRRPALVAAFEGWNDAANAASSAATWLVRHFGAQRFARIEPDQYFDFGSHRPEVELVDGVTRALRWPTTDCFAAVVPASDRDLVIVVGLEPNYHWRTFCDATIAVAREMGCELVVTFGALLADVAHTRPVRLTGAANDPDLVTRLGLEHSRYEGPTGIVGVLHHRCREMGLPSVSLWAPVPHYLAAPPDPVASRALLDRFGALVGVALDLQELDDESDAWRRRIDEFVAADPEATAYVGQLEERGDSAAREELEHASGEALAAELERFLREQRGDD